MKIDKHSEKYISSVYQIATDIWVWTEMLKKTIANLEKESNPPQTFFSSIFTVYDIDSGSNNGLLNIYSNESKQISTHNINDQKEDFLRWVRCLSILRIYNAIEIFVLSSIYDHYFKGEISFENYRNKSYLITEEIRKYFVVNNLGKFDTTNNKHLIKFLSHKEPELKIFFSQKVRVDLNTDWQQFFELLSLLRNVVAHNSMLLTKDALNQIKSQAKDIYERHFSNDIVVDELILLNPHEAKFSNLLSMVNDFTLNTVKLIKGEPNLNFGGFYKVKLP